MNLKFPVEFCKEHLEILRECQTVGISETFALIHTLYLSLNINWEGAAQSLTTQWGRTLVSTVGEHL